MASVRDRIRRLFSKGHADERIEDYIVGDDLVDNPDFRSTKIPYKDPRLAAKLPKLPLYQKGTHQVGDIVRFENNGIAQMLVVQDRLQPIFISPYKEQEKIDAFIAGLDRRLDHQKLLDIKWPLQSDPQFLVKVQKIFAELGFRPEAKTVDPLACQKILANKEKALPLKYYQKLASTYLVYGPYRGLLVWAGPGSGKTCTAIAAIDNFIKFNKGEISTHSPANRVNLVESKPVPKKSSPNVFIVLPPRGSLIANMQKEMTRCPSVIRDLIVKAKSEGKMDMTNRIINKYVVIISYVSLSNRLKKGVMDIENSLVILDEAHNLLEAPAQYRVAYKYLYDRLRAAKNIKILMLTATPVFRSVADLPRLLNLLKRPDEAKLPETEQDIIKKYFEGKVMRKDAFVKDIRGLISYLDIEDDTSYFAKKVYKLPIITHVTEPHYKKWQNSKQGEDKKYEIKEGTSMADLLFADNKKFKNPVTGFFKTSSATANVPLHDRKAGTWPDKFHQIAEQIKEKYPREKHFVYSRHKSQGAVAIGTFLEEQGFVRMSNNKADHGSNPPKSYNPLGKELMALSKTKMDDAAREKAKAALISKYVQKPYMGFVVLNSSSSQREIDNSRELFNDRANMDGKLCRVFIGDETFSEGVSLNHTLHVHIIEPPYSYEALRQIQARAVRFCSHEGMKWPWEVKIHTYLSALDQQHQTTDALLQEYQAESKAQLQQIINASVESSLEYGFDRLAATVSTPLVRQLGFWRRLLGRFSRTSAPAV